MNAQIKVWRECSVIKNKRNLRSKVYDTAITVTMTAMVVVLSMPWKPAGSGLPAQMKREECFSLSAVLGISPRDSDLCLEANA